jgi:spore maturation protein CgeB
MVRAMKILIADNYYPAFLAHALAEMNHADLSYDEMLAGLLAQRFGTADFYSRNLRNLGVDARDIIFNCEPLQRRWAEERGLSARTRPNIVRLVTKLPVINRWAGANDDLLTNIAVRQIREFRPDVLYLQDLSMFRPSLLTSLKDDVGLVVGQIASPLPSSDYLKVFDLILTSFPHYVDRLRALGVKSEYFRIGFDPIVLKELGDVNRHRPCTFVGGLSGAHTGRTRFLEELARSVDIEFFGYGLDTLSESSPIRSRHRGEAWALDMYRALAESIVTVNVHIDVAENHANNMRLFEATGCGALLVTDQKDNLGELFEPGIEIIAYRDVAEAVQQIQYYLGEKGKAEAIARAGQKRTLREHTYRRRMEELVEILEKHRRAHRI